MMDVTFREVIEWTGARSVDVPLDRAVRSMTIDSRETDHDSLFVALPGTRTHGHQYVAEVWRRGAVALVEESFSEIGGPTIIHPSPLDAMGMLMHEYIGKRDITVVGITGSVGKTSVKELCGAVLSSRYHTTQSLGNYNTAIGLPLSFFSAPSQVTHFVAEMAMRAPGEIRRLTEIAPPKIAVMTNIGPSHLASLGSMEAIQRAKGEILQGLNPSGTAVLNYDDPWVRELGEKTGQRVAWYGRQAGLDVQILSAELVDDATMIHLRIDARIVEVRLPWLGAHHAYNVAAAFLVGLNLGLNEAEILRGISGIEQMRSRIRREELGSLVLLEDVYNASPVSMKAGLEVLQAHAGRKVAVLGDMFELGSAEETSHRQVGEIAGRIADWVVGVGERSRWIVEEADRAGCAADWASSRSEALALLRSGLKAGDTVFLKASRGMEFERLISALKDWGGPE